MTAFINALREEGTKEDCLAAVERLWDQLTDARLAGKVEGMEEALRIWHEQDGDGPCFLVQARAKIAELSSTDSASHSSEAEYTTAPLSEEPSA